MSIDGRGQRGLYAASGDNLTPLSCLLAQVGVLMNNAAIGAKGTSWDGLENWHKVFDVNLFGCVP